jgi:hypothetical protein
MKRRLLVCAPLGLAVIAMSAATAWGAQTPTCGSTDKDGNTVLGTLALNDSSSSTTRSYGSDTGHHRLALLFDVSGCALPANATIGNDDVTLLPAKTGDDLPDGSAVKVSVPKPDPTALVAVVALNLADIDPGTRGGIVRIHLPGILHDSYTPISESRTSAVWWSLGLGFAGALAGLLWAVGLHVAETIPAIRFSRLQWVFVGALTVGAGLVAGFAYWDNQDVWTLGDNGWATLAAGFTAATTGALAGVTTALLTGGGGGSTPPPPADPTER